MTGAKNLLGGEDSLQFRIGRGAKDGCNSVRITLDDVTDTYTVTFYKIGRGPTFKVTDLGAVSFVHADSLRRVFTDATGLDVVAVKNEIALIVTDETFPVIAFTCAALPGFKVQASPNNWKDAASRWSGVRIGRGLRAHPLRRQVVPPAAPRVETAVRSFFAGIVARRAA